MRSYFLVIIHYNHTNIFVLNLAIGGVTAVGKVEFLREYGITHVLRYWNQLSALLEKSPLMFYMFVIYFSIVEEGIYVRRETEVRSPTPFPYHAHDDNFFAILEILLRYHQCKRYQRNKPHPVLLCDESVHRRRHRCWRGTGSLVNFIRIYLQWFPQLKIMSLAVLQVWVDQQRSWSRTSCTKSKTKLLISLIAQNLLRALWIYPQANSLQGCVRVGEAASRNRFSESFLSCAARAVREDEMQSGSITRAVSERRMPREGWRSWTRETY